VTLPAASAAALQPDGQPEEFHYHWKLGNLFGKVAGLFFPGRGDGLLTFTPGVDTLTSELFITSGQSAEGEFWRYGAESDRASLQARRAWSSYLWRGKAREKDQPIVDRGVMEITSGIYAIRRDPPAAPRKMEIWSDGKTYPVLAIPRGEEEREVAGRKIATRRFSIRGFDAPGRNRWKGSVELWLADDPAATPVEIRIERSLAHLHLEITELPDGVDGGAAAPESP
jgi:hypothetical protein